MQIEELKKKGCQEEQLCIYEQPLRPLSAESVFTFFGPVSFSASDLRLTCQFKNSIECVVKVCSFLFKFFFHDISFTTIGNSFMFR